jgi:hypothetical protein
MREVKGVGDGFGDRYRSANGVSERSGNDSERLSHGFSGLEVPEAVDDAT